MTRPQLPVELVLLMEEAALLPRDAPLRRECEHLVARKPEELRAHWEALVAETDLLREGLSFELPVPVGLESRLRSMPSLSPRRSAAFRRAVIAAGIAAAMAIAFVTHRAHSLARTVSDVAALAAANHAHDAHVSVTTTDVGEVQRRLTQELRFDVGVPNLGPDTVVVGGRKCALGTTPVAYIALRRHGRDAALFVFRATSAGLPVDLDVSTERVLPASVSSAYDVTVWTRLGSGFALVEHTNPREE